MIIFIFALVAICLYRIKFSGFHSDYMSISKTNSIKGIFAVIILLSHLRSYIVLPENMGNKLFVIFLNILGQLMVTMFFFYSGYGIMESYRQKANYDKGFFKKRILKTLVHFDIAVLLFLIASLLIGKSYVWQNYVLCWIGWESLGNSNWFVFVILALYLLTFVAMKLANMKEEKSEVVFISLVAILSAVLWVVLFLAKGGTWCNTLWCYPLGMLYSLIKPKLDNLLHSKKYIYWIALAITAIGVAILYLLRSNVVVYSVLACVFVLLLTFVTVKVQMDNKILQWLGKYSFSIYILQRLPMILLKNFGLAENLLIFSVVSITATLLLAVGYQKCTNLIDKKIFG